MVLDITNVVTYTNFGDHRLRGFCVAGVKFSPFPLTDRRSYNTLAREYVILSCHFAVMHLVTCITRFASM